MKFLYSALVLFLFAAFSSAQSLVTAAKVVRITDSGMILQVGTEPLAVDPNPKTRYWKGRSTGKRDAYTAGENVMVRINTKEDPPELKEIACESSWKWLEDIRKKALKGTIEKVDPKFVTVKFGDGTSFAYRATEKSEVSLKGKSAALSDLTPGSVVYVKGRTLPTLDIWAVSISDVAPPEPKATSKTTKADGPQKAKLKPLDATGTIQAEVVSHTPEIRMFDVDQDGRKLHITYTTSTVFTLDAKTSRASEIASGQQARITYKRDKAGRLVASRVELSSS
ncbi:MAG TPA: DUF5666 domain-containing protein [Fimbriimonadaceae bacterium]|nr:DUF5666 domain-containing protein [Fimbriimonadaceae bacterium]